MQNLSLEERILEAKRALYSTLLEKNHNSYTDVETELLFQLSMDKGIQNILRERLNNERK